MSVVINVKIALHGLQGIKFRRNGYLNLGQGLYVKGTEFMKMLRTMKQTNVTYLTRMDSDTETVFRSGNFRIAYLKNIRTHGNGSISTLKDNFSNVEFFYFNFLEHGTERIAA